MKFKEYDVLIHKEKQHILLNIGFKPPIIVIAFKVCNICPICNVYYLKGGQGGDFGFGGAWACARYM